MHRLNLNGYEPDRHHEAAVAFCIHAGTDELTSPVHQHRKGQLILALHGAITCTVENALWMVPPQYAVWIPGGVKHSNQVTANAELCFLFIEPSAVTMPVVWNHRVSSTVSQFMSPGLILLNALWPLS